MSISTRTTLAFALFALLCAGTTGALLSTMASDDFEEIVVDRQRLFAMQGALAFLDDLELAILELEHVSRMVEVDLDDDDDDAERRVLNEAWRLTLFFFDGAVVLVDETGRCHGAEPGECGSRDFRAAPWFAEGVRATGPIVHFGDGDDTTLALVVPMREESGELEGLLRGEIRLDRGDFFDDSVYGTGPGSHDLVLLSEDGRELFVHGHPPLEAPAWRDAVARSDRAGARAVTVEGERLVLAWAPIGTTGARLVYAWPFRELDRTGDERARALLVAAAVIAFVGMLVGLLVARRLTEPVLVLEGDVRAARGGKGRIDPHGARDEVGTLRRAFAELVDELAAGEENARSDRDRIAELADTLEERVRSRTRELEETRDALVDAERLAALGRAGAALSHELRNSLNALSVGMDALGGSLPDAARMAVRQQVREEIGRLRTLADVLLDFARPRKVERRTSSSAVLLSRSHAFVEDFAVEHGVSLEVEPGDDDPLEVDAGLLQSVFVNLLRNGVEAATGREVPRVHARSWRTDDAWCVEVEDGGPGVAPEVRERLFQPFSSGRVGGVGLGLALARRFVELHGGRLELLEPGALGGARFRVTIPLDVPDSEVS
ncbi:MAG: sensor histidine kinase [Sandaracinus sp.]|nr:sensor histidine kinase [Sandaracinus sp.]MCB9618735.1 sensor histidine kinase [Sandaracinus sp.]